MRVIDHFVAGGPLPDAARFADILDPNNGGVQAQVALGNAAVLDIAVAAASAAQPAWAATNPQRRARVMFRFQGRYPARSGSGRICLRAAARDEG